MQAFIEIRISQLRVASAFLVNVAAGLSLAPVAVKDHFVLTMSLILAIVYLLIAVKIEDIIEEYA